MKRTILMLLSSALWLAGGVSSVPAAAAVMDSTGAVRALEAWLKLPRESRPALSNQAFHAVPLTQNDSTLATRLLWEDHADFIRRTRAAEMQAGVIELDSKKMRFATVSFGDTNKIPSDGRSLFISMHGGGGAPPAVNDSQWKNQIRLGQAYAPKEGIYLAPRAPTDAWNLWHQTHIDRFFSRLIENLIVLGPVNPDRVYILGYSAGGDGVYQLAPRIADRLAAAAMMAGHPNEASPVGLRNLPFAIQVGALDNGFKRNEVALEWGRKLEALQKSDPQGYVHFVELHAGKPHWMDLQDRKAIPWMEKFNRNPLPAKVAWRQDDVTHDSFYWLAVPPSEARVNQEIHAERQGAVITINKASGVTNFIVRLNDRMISLDQPVIIRHNERNLFQGKANRTINVIAATLAECGDPKLVFSAEVPVKLVP